MSSGHKKGLLSMRHMRIFRGECRIGGHTLVELLITVVISLIALSVIYLSFSSDRKSFYHQMSALRIRQDARVAMNSISQLLRMGTHIYANQAKMVEGHTFQVPAKGAGGNELLFASPEEGEGALTYTVRGYYLRDRVPRDGINPGARQLMMYQKERVAPASPEDPATIDFGVISGGSTRILADYVRPAAPMFTISTDGKSVELHMQTEKKISAEMPAQHEELKTSVKMRN
jgi:hypothetical protein